MSKLTTLTIEKLIPGGQGMGRLEDGRVCFVWGALPGETVEVFITKKKKSFAQAVVNEVLEASKERIMPKDEAYLSTSPWQTMAWEYENKQKQQLIVESFTQSGVELPAFEIQTDNKQYAYRNKIEFSFWWVPESDTVELAFFRRGSSSKVIVDDTSLAVPELNQAAQHVRNEINRLGIQAKQLKTLLLRSDQNGRVAGALFCKDKDVPFVDFELGPLQGLEIWYSNHKSPASVATELLYRHGEVELKDIVLDREFAYDIHSFFQVNLPVYEQALSDIKQAINGQPVVDMYSGVGSIGLSVSGEPILVEADDASVTFAEFNAVGNELSEVYHESAEQVSDLIDACTILIVDPPRAGLHKKLIAKIAHTLPPKIVYLSCDAATHARDVAMLADIGYKIKTFKAYNFFPRTPHTETLAVLERS